MARLTQVITRQMLAGFKWWYIIGMVIQGGRREGGLAVGQVWEFW